MLILLIDLVMFIMNMLFMIDMLFLIDILIVAINSLQHIDKSIQILLLDFSKLIKHSNNFLNDKNLAFLIHSHRIIKYIPKLI